MAKIKASRNKTIDTPLNEGEVWLNRCLRLNGRPQSLDAVLDKIILGDFFATAPLLPPACADLIVVDPPYNLTKSFNGTVFSKKNKADYEAYTRRWLSLLQGLLKDTGSIYVCCDWQSSLIIGNVLADFFQVRNRITWQREKGRGAQANWKNSQEEIWFATKSNAYIFNLDAVKMRRRVLAPYRAAGQPKDWQPTAGGNYRDTCPSNFWDDITVPFWSMPENTAHPTQKPEKLLAKIILASSNPGDVVLDPFLGSGSTSVAAKKLGRHYIGIEVEPQYCLWAEQRLAQAEANPTIQGYADGVFWERNSLAERQRLANQPE